MQLYTENRAWEEITKAAEGAREAAYVAVAYFGTGASALLPLRPGSILIVDLSERAVRSGQTNPSELLKYKGVQIHSVTNLHAKVFVIGRWAFVGSTNASNNSAGKLIEATLKTADEKIGRACRRFVKDLCGEEVSPDRLKQLEKIYRPPSGQGRGGRKPKTLEPHHLTLWAVPLWYDWDENDQQAFKAGSGKAEAKLTSKARFEIDGFSEERPGLTLRRGDRVMTMDMEPDGRVYLNPPGEVIDIGYYRRGRKRLRMIYYARVKGARARSLKSARKRLGRLTRGLPKSRRAKKITDPRLCHAVLNLWYR